MESDIYSNIDKDVTFLQLAKKKVGFWRLVIATLEE